MVATRRTGGRSSMAYKADRYDLYQRAVQEPDVDLDFMTRVFKAEYGRAPKDLREDFCAAANTACHWVKRKPDHRAWGVDLDPEPIAWGVEHNVAPLLPTEEQRSRLMLVQGDVLTPDVVPPVDVTLAQNFSYFCFKTRASLLRYFVAARAGLRKEGLFIVDLFGGPDAQSKGVEVTRHKGFSYVWDQARYDAITNEIECHIDFRFPDGSQVKRAFSYDWRLWTIAEVIELLLEAGFSRGEAYWEGATKDGEGNGVYTRRAHADNELAWLSYVVGVA